MLYLLRLLLLLLDRPAYYLSELYIDIIDVYLLILRWGLLRFTSAAIQNRVTFVYTLEQSAGVEVLPRCVNDMGRELPATGGQNASPLHNQDHCQPTLLPSPLTP